MTKKARVIVGKLKDIETIPATFDENNNEISPSYCLLKITTLNKKREEDNVEIKYSGFIYNLDNNEKEYLVDNQNNLLKIENNEPLIIPCSKPILFSLAFLKNIFFVFFLIAVFLTSCLLTSYLSGDNELYIGVVLGIYILPSFLDINDSMGVIIIITCVSFFLITYLLSLYSIIEKNRKGKIKIYNVKGISFIKKIYSAWTLIP